MTERKMLEFGTLWKETRLDKLMDFFTEDAVYKPSVSINGKSIFIGKKEILSAIEMIQEYDDSIDSEVNNLFINHDFGFWEWEYTTRNGEKIKGCDAFEFEGDKIKIKNAFRKVNEK